jgi:thioredoxin
MKKFKRKMITYMSRRLNVPGFKREVLNGTGVSIVRFCTDWNGTCQMMAPLFDELESYYNSFIRFFTIDADKNPQMLREFGVHEVPTILFFRDGLIIDQIRGSAAKNILEEKVRSFLPKSRTNYNFFL